MGSLERFLNSSGSEGNVRVERLRPKRDADAAESPETNNSENRSKNIISDAVTSLENTLTTFVSK